MDVPVSLTHDAPSQGCFSIKKKPDRSRKQDNAFKKGTVGRQNITPYTAPCTHKKKCPTVQVVMVMAVQVP